MKDIKLSPAVSVLAFLLLASIVGNAVLWFGGNLRREQMAILDNPSEDELLKHVNVTGHAFMKIGNEQVRVLYGATRKDIGMDDRAYIYDKSGHALFSLPIESETGKHTLDLLKPYVVSAEKGPG